MNGVLYGKESHQPYVNGLGFNKEACVSLETIVNYTSNVTGQKMAEMLHRADYH